MKNKNELIPLLEKQQKTYESKNPSLSKISIDKLPNEVLQNVCSYLDYDSKAKFGQTCKRHRKIFENSYYNEDKKITYGVLFEKLNDVRVKEKNVKQLTTDIAHDRKIDNCIDHTCIPVSTLCFTSGGITGSIIATAALPKLFPLSVCGGALIGGTAALTGSLIALFKASECVNERINKKQLEKTQLRNEIVQMKNDLNERPVAFKMTK